MAWYHTIDWVAWGAFAAAAVALYGAWRANKIAEKHLSASIELQLIQFREKWIADLRNEMAGFASCITNPELSTDMIGKITSHVHKISLLMNSDDPLYSKLMVQMACISKGEIYAYDYARGRETISREDLVNQDPTEHKYLDERIYNVNEFEEISRAIGKLSLIHI